jgi:hypothetical protein
MTIYFSLNCYIFTAILVLVSLFPMGLKLDGLLVGVFECC